MTYRGHAVLQTLVRAYFSPAHSTGQRYIYAGNAEGDIIVWDIVSGKQVGLSQQTQASAGHGLSACVGVWVSVWLAGGGGYLHVRTFTQNNYGRYAFRTRADSPRLLGFPKGADPAGSQRCHQTELCEHCPEGGLAHIWAFYT
jgi:hypothetical protein